MLAVSHYGHRHLKADTYKMDRNPPITTQGMMNVAF